MVDPRAQGPQPPYSEQTQEPPGTEADLRPRADHGQNGDHRGDRLQDRVAIVTRRPWRT